MSEYIDLHTHSTFSDGTLTPEEIVLLAKEKGLKAVAITDHDTLTELMNLWQPAKSMASKPYRELSLHHTMIF